MTTAPAPASAHRDPSPDDGSGAGSPAVSSPREVASRDPATGEVWRRYDAAGAPEIAAALDAARAAQPAWSARPLRERVAILGRFRRLLYDARQEVAGIVVRENGKATVEGLGEVMLVLDLCAFYMKAAPRELKPRTFRSASLAMFRKRITISQEPIGVLGVIAPWNYPLMLAAGHVLPALVAGNAVLLKPSELTPTTAVRMVELLHAAGIPHEVLHVLPGAGAAGAALVSSGVDKMFFTGSERTGRLVAAECGRRMIPCVLELGGSDPAIVLEDAPLGVAADGIVFGRFYNAGQTCVAPKRVFVVDAVHDAFVREVSARVDALSVGAATSGAEVGPLIHPAQVAALTEQYEDAIARGAQVAARSTLAKEGPGYFPPTVLTGVTDDMQVLREETFGPLLPIVRVRDADDAVRRANATTYGLSASIWTGDARRGVALAHRLQAGSVMLNDVLLAAGIAEVPHGGVKASGMGRSHGVAGLLECVQSKAIVSDRFPHMRQLWWYRYTPDLERGFDAFLRLAHGRSLPDRLAGLFGVRRLLRRK
ncbi:MAG: aldehyde dehydrogenase family protein [Gemmatimonadaceae bacterium]